MEKFLKFNEIYWPRHVTRETHFCRFLCRVGLWPDCPFWSCCWLGWRRSNRRQVCLLTSPSPKSLCIFATFRRLRCIHGRSWKRMNTHSRDVISTDGRKDRRTDADGWIIWFEEGCTKPAKDNLKELYFHKLEKNWKRSTIKWEQKGRLTAVAQ